MRPGIVTLWLPVSLPIQMVRAPLELQAETAALRDKFLQQQQLMELMRSRLSKFEDVEKAEVSVQTDPIDFGPQKVAHKKKKAKAVQSTVCSTAPPHAC